MTAPAEAQTIPADAPPHERARISAMQLGGGSATIRADSLFNMRTQYRASTGFDHGYYEMKWGGREGKEKWTKPFNV